MTTYPPHTFTCRGCRREIVAPAGRCHRCRPSKLRLARTLPICESNRCGHFGVDSKCRRGCQWLPRPCRLADRLLKGTGCAAPTPQWGPPEPVPSPVRSGPRTEFPRNRVGFLAVAYTDCGGTEIWHQTLLPRIRDLVSGFVCTNEGLTGGDFSLLRCPHGVGLDAARQLAASSDVLVVWGVGADLDQVLAGMADPPTVISVSHCDFRSGWTDAFMRDQSPHAAHNVIICNSGIETVPVEHRDHVTLIQNAPDPARVVPTESREATRERYGIRPHERLVVGISRISKEKGCDVIARAVQALGEPYRLIWPGSVAEWCRDYAESLRSDPDLSRTQWIDAVLSPADLLNAADLYCAAPEYEGYGLSTAEAILAGVPVISTPVGLLEDDRSLARLVDLGSSPELWAAAIADEIEHPDQARVARAQTVIRDEHNVDAWVTRWRELIHSLAPPKATGATL